MNFESDSEVIVTDDWAERRTAAVRRLGGLIRRLGPCAIDSPESLDTAMAEALANCPAERDALSDALKLRATSEINRLRDSDDPKTYLPAVAEALANQTGHPRELALWAVHTWHDVLAAPLPPKFTEPVKPPAPPGFSATLTSAFIIGAIALFATGIVECVLIRNYGPTIVETALAERAWPKSQSARTHDRERRSVTGPRMTTLAPIGFVLTGSVAGLAAFCGWGLGGGTVEKLAKGGGVAALAGASSCGILNLIAVHSRGGLILAPQVEALAILSLVGIITFAVVYPVASGTTPEPWPDEEHPRDPFLYENGPASDVESPGRDGD